MCRFYAFLLFMFTVPFNDAKKSVTHELFNRLPNSMNVNISGKNVPAGTYFVFVNPKPLYSKI